MTTTSGSAHLVLVGGGHTHVEVLRVFALRPVPDVRLTIVSRDTHALYSGMLPGLIAGHYGWNEAHIDLKALSRKAGAQLVLDEVVGLDAAGGTVRCRSGLTLAGDLVSLDVGSTPSLSVPGSGRHAIPVKPISALLTRWEAMRARVLAHPGQVRIAVVGGGAGGVELVLAVQHGLRTAPGGGRPARDLDLHLFTPSLLPALNRRARQSLAGILGARGIQIHAGSRVVEVDAGGLRTSDGQRHALDEVLWVTEAAAAPWVSESGVAVNDAGFVRVNETLRSVSHPRVFASGDIASLEGRALQKSGVVAVRQAPFLAHNLRHALAGGRLRRYRPQRHHLALISTGDRHAVASRGPWTVQGDWVWRLKDWIDCRFVRRYNDAPGISVGPQ